MADSANESCVSFFGFQKCNPYLLGEEQFELSTSVQADLAKLTQFSVFNRGHIDNVIENDCCFGRPNGRKFIQDIRPNEVHVPIQWRRNEFKNDLNSNGFIKKTAEKSKPTSDKSLFDIVPKEVPTRSRGRGKFRNGNKTSNSNSLDKTYESNDYETYEIQKMNNESNDEDFSENDTTVADSTIHENAEEEEITDLKKAVGLQSIADLIGAKNIPATKPNCVDSTLESAFLKQEVNDASNNLNARRKKSKKKWKKFEPE